MSLRLRMALMSAIAIAAVVAIFGAAVFAVTAIELYSVASNQLQAEQNRLQQRLERFELAPLPSYSGDIYINGYSPAGTRIRQVSSVGSRRLPLSRKRLTSALEAPNGTSTRYTVLISGSLYLLQVVTMRGRVLLPGTGPYTRPVPVQVLVLGEDVSSAYRTVQVLGLILIIAGSVITA
ncbi:MAG: hypothetical protein ACREQM_09075, partial [Candidatus Dormibacteraceae bacterium]